MNDSTLGVFMREEILEQPQAVSRTLRREAAQAEALGALLRRRRVRFAVLAGRGTSDHAAIIGKYLFEWGLGVPAALAAPSIVTLYKRPLRLKDAVVIGISQSGRSPDVAEYVSKARAAGAVTVAITNDESSPLAKGARFRLLCQAGPERSLAATKTFTTELACLYLLAGHWMGGVRGRRFLAELEGAPAMIAAALKQEGRVAAAMRSWRATERLVILSRGFSYPVALETALKLKESAGVFAEGASAADFLHGPIGMARRQGGASGLRAILLAPRGPGLSSLRRVRARLGKFHVPTLTFDAPRVHDTFSPFPLAVFGQLCALHLSRQKGLNADKPAGLKKVTHVR
ncbi:MAG: SIS domain-containing protein [Elusimicrobia bacterium]|nr:SIS domain-containing protein [Elusimicrobiota bacterium]